MSCVREQYQCKGLSENAVAIIMSSRRDKTQKQYQTYIKKWQLYCNANNISFDNPTVCDVIHYLESLFSLGFSYSVLNTVRSAISSIAVLRDSELSLGSHPIISRFMRGAFNLRPALPRYVNTWDVSVVIRHLKNQSPTESLTFKSLTIKLVMLMALLSGQRAQTLHLLDIRNIDRSVENTVTFMIDQKLKQTRPGCHVQPISFRQYTLDVDLCVVRTLDLYLEQSKPFRGETYRLFVSYQKPYKAVAPETISRWLKSVLTCAGIDTDQFKGHSVRSASTSAAYNAGASIESIMKAAGWSSERTFDKYYKKDVNINTFADNVLRAVKDC